MTEIFVSEVFSAIQGEAALVGERQVFVRLMGCNIRCAYCDQPEALERRAGPCRIEQSAGRRDWRLVGSPLPVVAVADAVDRLAADLPHHSVSLTGGEPLFQASSVPVLAAELRRRGHRLYLETNGMLAGALGRVLPELSYVSMDLKLPSVDGEHVRPATQRQFLALAAGADHVETFCKIVIGAQTDPDELDQAVRMVHEVAPMATVFLQPVTPFAAVRVAPAPEHVLALQELALRAHRLVRVIPQTHKMIGQL